MKVSELGEFGLVDLLSRMVAGSRNKDAASWSRLIMGIGDDCAAWRGDSTVQLAHVDSVIEGVHFTLDTTPWADLGWKALAVTVSDIAAMGGIPAYALVSLTLRDDNEVDDVAEMYRGMLELAQRFDVAIVGGDTGYAPVVSATVTAFGSTGKRDVSQLLTRNSSRSGDKIAVTGYPGSAAAGLRMLTDRLSLSHDADIYFRQAFLRPMPRVAEGQKLVEMGVRAGIDISDGLLSDLGHVCKLSGVGARINVASLPLHSFTCRYFREEAVNLALSGGEDYELLFTAAPGIMDNVKASLACPVTIIGEITRENPGKVMLVDEVGHPLTPAAAGWEHFKSARAEPDA